MRNLSFLFLLLIVYSCKDDDGASGNEYCILMTDQNGLPLGVFGDCNNANDQWTNFPLSENELAFLDFNKTFDPPCTEIPGITGIAAYPNPVNDSRVMSISLISPDTCDIILKLAFVDDQNERVFWLSQGIAGNGSITLLLQEPEFVSGEFYRFYYEVIAGPEATSVFTGYGDVLICDVASIGDPAEDCF